MKSEEAAARVREMLADNGRRQFPFLTPTEEKATRALLEGFEAAVDDLNRDGSCDTCKRGPDNHKCGKCGVGCYEWRGPCAENMEGGGQE